MFKDSGAFYNSLEIAQTTLVENGVPEDRISLIEASEDGRIDLEDESIDLVISTISWGFHYPVSTYLDSVHRILSENGSLIIDVRDDTGGAHELRSKFSLEKVEGYEKHTKYNCKKGVRL